MTNPFESTKTRTSFCKDTPTISNLEIALGIQINLHWKRRYAPLA